MAEEGARRHQDHPPVSVHGQPRLPPTPTRSHIQRARPIPTASPTCHPQSHPTQDPPPPTHRVRAWKGERVRGRIGGSEVTESLSVYLHDAEREGEKGGKEGGKGGVQVIEVRKGGVPRDGILVRIEIHPQMRLYIRTYNTGTLIQPRTHNTGTRIQPRTYNTGREEGKEMDDPLAQEKVADADQVAESLPINHLPPFPCRTPPRTYV